MAFMPSVRDLDKRVQSDRHDTYAHMQDYMQYIHIYTYIYTYIQGPGGRTLRSVTCQPLGWPLKG